MSCAHPPTARHGLILFELATVSPPTLEVVDVANPARPVLDCTLSPAQGGQFAGSGTTVRYVYAGHLGLADLSTGTVTETAQLPVPASEGTFSSDGSKFAYRFFDDTGAMTTHIFSGGRDQVLYTQSPIGGHGGLPAGQGPFDQLEFSPDGSLLLDYMTFRPTDGNDNLLVFDLSGRILLQELGNVSGVWAPTGSTLYYPVWAEGGPTGELDSFTVTGGSQKIATGLKGYYWPAMSPDGKAIWFDSYDSSVPGCGGLPHLWRFDVSTGRAAQVAKSTTSHPVFVAREVIWSNHEVATQCGPDGASAPDGAVVGHNLSTGVETTVDLRSVISNAGQSDVGHVVDALL